jgi:hypothetical protein
MLRYWTVSLSLDYNMDNLPVSVAELKEYLWIDGEEENIILAGFIAASKEHCENYLKTSLQETLPTPVKQAFLILAGHFYERRDGADIPKTVYALLAPYREAKW